MRISDWSSAVCSSDLLRPGSSQASTLEAGQEFGGGLRHLRDLSRCRWSASGERASGCGRVPVIEQGRISGAGNLGRARTAWNDLRAAHGGGESAASSEEHTSELQSPMRHSYAVFCLKKKNTTNTR